MLALNDVVATLPTEVAVKRSDPVYNAHAYLTKVPYSAIVPFVEALTEPGDCVLDVFAGSGMTGVAAVMAGRRAEMRDIAVLGRHLGENYLRLVDAGELQRASEEVMARAARKVGDVYACACAGCKETGALSKTVWSFVYACPACGASINYYEAFERSGWKKSAMTCDSCGELFRARGASRVEQVRVLDHVKCQCSRTIREQASSAPLVPVDRTMFDYPDVEIGSERQMFQASALAKHGLLTTAAFFSDRNLAVLSALHAEINALPPSDVREKLRFAFTAILARASKRYQWHPKRPLNASNHNYYIAPVFYEWNVYELFARKVSACMRSDSCIRQEMHRRNVDADVQAKYANVSADALDLPTESVDYVFTDPPFGSNIFYSDMNLFQEVWLREFTEDEREAVVDRTGDGPNRRSSERYEDLICGALRECHRVLKPKGWLSLVFSNSSGAMWQLVQRSVLNAGFVLEHVSALDKGQRSVKGLASGFEGVVTSDLILTMRKARDDERPRLSAPPESALKKAIDGALNEPGRLTPTKIYLHIVTGYLRAGWDVSSISISDVRAELVRRGLATDAATASVVAGATAA